MNIVYNHLHFRSEDPDAAAKWYCDNFGARITSERPLSTTKSIQLALNGRHLMTISGRAEGENPVPGSTEPRYGLDHFGFETDDLDGLAAQLKANGRLPMTDNPGIGLELNEAAVTEYTEA